MLLFAPGVPIPTLRHLSHTLLPALFFFCFLISNPKQMVTEEHVPDQ